MTQQINRQDKTASNLLNATPDVFSALNFLQEQNDLLSYEKQSTVIITQIYNSD